MDPLSGDKLDSSGTLWHGPGEPAVALEERPCVAPVSGVAQRRRASRVLRRHLLRDCVRVGVLVMADLVAAAAAVGLVAGLRGSWPASLTGIGEFFPPDVPVAQHSLALVLGLVVAGAYGAGERRRDAGRILFGTAVAGALTAYSALWVGDAPAALLGWFAVAAVLGLAAIPERSLVDVLVRRARPRLPHRIVVVSGPERRSSEVVSRLKAAGLRVVGSVVLGTNEEREGDLAGLGDLVEIREADTVLVVGELSETGFAAVVDTAVASGCRLLSEPRHQRLVGMEPRSAWVDGLPFVQLTAPTLKASQLFAKRCIDLVGSLAAIVVLSPLMAAIALWIKLHSPGPVFFRQTRLGARGSRFRCFKFRSMRADAEELLRSDPAFYDEYVAHHFKLPAHRDPRLTRSGRFLRRTSLDELPQLFNVVLGQMSLVGPRPIVPAELDHYGDGAPLFLSLKPGMTGLWAVRGRSGVGYPDRAQMELQYVREWSLLQDLGILCRTIPVVLRRRGAH